MTAIHCFDAAFWPRHGPLKVVLNLDVQNHYYREK